MKPKMLYLNSEHCASAYWCSEENVANDLLSDQEMDNNPWLLFIAHYALPLEGFWNN